MIRCLVCTLVCFASCLDVHGMDRPQRTPGYEFVDEHGKPMDVLVMEGTTVDAAASPRKLQWESVAKGTTYSPSKNDKEGFENSLFVCAKGYAVDLLALGAEVKRNYEIQMEPEDTIRVQVLDERGLPVVNARVWPAEIEFDKSAWIANAPFSVPDWMTARTNQDGFANLHGAKRDFLRGVYVAKEGKRGVQYIIPRLWDREATIPIRMKPATGSLRCEVLDESGNPVVGARLYAVTNEEWRNPEAIRTTEAVFNEFLGETDATGQLVVAEIPECVINVRLFSHSRSAGYCEYRKDILVNLGQETKIAFRLKGLQQVVVSLVNSSDQTSLANVPIRFVYREKGESCTSFAETDEDGIATFWLQPGLWQYEIEEAKLPGCYCASRESVPRTLLVVESNELQVAKPLFAEQGRVIEGQIVDLDPRKLRNDWIQMETEEATWMNDLTADGGFRFVVPKSIKDEDIVGFQMATRILTPPSKLQIETKEPWLLRLVPRDTEPR